MLRIIDIDLLVWVLMLIVDVDSRILCCVERQHYYETYPRICCVVTLSINPFHHFSLFHFLFYFMILYTKFDVDCRFMNTLLCRTTTTLKDDIFVLNNGHEER